jgi:hypothetical protein
VIKTEWERAEEEVQRIFRIAEPDLIGKNIYLLDTAKMTGSNAPSERTLAFTGLPSDHLIVRPFIDYKGPGAVIFFSAAAFERFARYDDDATRFHFEAIMLHELAHVLALGDCFDPPPEPAISPVAMDTYRNGIIHHATAPRSEACDKNYAILYLQHHNPSWIRACCHLKARVEERTGKIIALSAIIAKGFPPHESYFGRAIESETRSLARWPIASILKLPLPPAFAELWERNVSEFHRFEAERKAEREAAKANHQSRQGNVEAAGAVPALSDAGKDAKEVDRMNLASFFSDVANLFTRRDTEIKSSVAQLARDIADGKKPTAERAAQILRDSGETVASLQAAAERILRRRDWRRTLDAAVAIGPKREEIAKAAGQADHKRQRAEEEFYAATWQLAVKERELDTVQASADNARAELAKTASSERLAALKEAEVAHGKLNGALWEARRQLAEAVGVRKGFSPVVERAASHYKEGNATGHADVWRRDDMNFPSLDAFNTAVGKVMAANDDIARFTASVAELENQLAAADARVAAAKSALLEVD